MVASIIATPEPANVPPRVRLDLDTGSSGEVFSAIEVRRDGVVIRTIPVTGSQVSVVYDYDCPFGQTVEYSVTGTVDGLSELHDEDWANLTGWSTVSGTPTVDPGFERLTGGVVDQTIATPFPDSGRLAAAITLAFTPLVGPGLLRIGPLGFSVSGGPSGITALLVNYYDDSDAIIGSMSVAFFGGGDFVATWGDGQITVTTDSETKSISGTPAGADIYMKATAELPGFNLSEIISDSPFGPLSDTALLEVEEAWLIHPINPDLSVSLGGDGATQPDTLYVQSTSAQSVVYRSRRTVFSPLGNPRQVPVTYGSRRFGEWSLVLYAPTAADQDAVKSLLADQSPILLRVPPSFPWDLEEGWYSVDDLEGDRTNDTPTETPRSYTLPLMPVVEPVLIQGAQWTYADELTRNLTYADSLAEFPTYLERLVGPTS